VKSNRTLGLSRSTTSICVVAFPAACAPPLVSVRTPPLMN
jgi:hypothetical protein